MYRLSFILSLFFSFLLQGNSQYWSDSICLEKDAFSQLSEDPSSSSVWGLLSLFESEEIEVEEENEEHKCTPTIIGGQSLGYSRTSGLPIPLHPYQTTSYTYSTQKKSALFVLFGQFLI